jgi:dephospho-CoA kinase
LLVENRANYEWVDRILVVDVPEAIQIERLTRRDGVDEALARKMIAAQASRERRMAIADDVIVNEGSELELAGKVAELHQRYLGLARG